MPTDESGEGGFIATGGEGVEQVGVRLVGRGSVREQGADVRYQVGGLQNVPSSGVRYYVAGRRRTVA